ncbi:MAG TPA: site-specific integrase [Afifellaceae bacterium]|nr:site-specific integrase [Afifellaceae bacterium]
MPKPTFLHRVGDRWYYERRVPTSLVPIIKMHRWRKALGTGDEREALRRARALGSDHDRVIEEARRKQAMSPAERALSELADAERHYHAALARLQQIEIAEQDNGVDSTLGERKAASAMLERARADARAAVIAEGDAKLPDLAAVTGLVRAKVSAAGGVAALVQGAEEARISERLELTAAELLGETDPDREMAVEDEEAIFDEVAALKARAARSAERRREKTDLLDRLGLPGIGSRPVRTSGPTIQDLYERWREECGISQDRSLKVEVCVRRFREIFGEIGAADIARSHVKEYAATLEQLPSSAFLKIKERGSDVPTLLTIVEARPDLPRLRRTAIKRHLQALSAILSWAVEEELVASNPFLHAKPPATAGEPTKIKPFRPDELCHLLSHVDVAWRHPDRRKDIDRWWITYVAAYSGARLAEICQLEKRDVRQEWGVWIIDINDEHGKQVKNNPSIRKVPIHPRLIELGFLEYVAGVQDGGRIFSSLKVYANGRLAHDVSNTFGWLKRNKAGFTSRSHNFHSLRHSFSDACRQAGMPAEIRESLMGHQVGNRISSGYGEGYPLAVLAQWMARMEPLGPAATEVIHAELGSA